MELIAVYGWHLKLYAPQNSLKRMMSGGKTLKLNIIPSLLLDNLVLVLTSQSITSKLTVTYLSISKSY